MANQKPIMKTRAGSVSLAVWQNDAKVNGQTVTLQKATIERRYKDKDGVWQSSNNFGRNEIPLAIYCLQKAFEFMLQQQGQDETVEEEVA